MDATPHLIAQINAYCVDCRWFWVAGLARETWPVLQHHLDMLHPWAVMAVTHYMEEQ